MAYFNSFTNTTVVLGPTGSTWTLRSENDNIYAYQNQGTLWNTSGVNGLPLLNQGTGSTGPTGSPGPAGESQVLTWTLGNSQNTGEFSYNSGSNVWEFNILDNQGTNATNWATSISSLYPYTSTILNIVGNSQFENIGISTVTITPFMISIGGGVLATTGISSIGNTYYVSYLLQNSLGLKGDTGDTGPTGAQGFTGPQGVKGDTGFIGPTGPQGIQGPAGLGGSNAIWGSFWSTQTQNVDQTPNDLYPGTLNNSDPNNNGVILVGGTGSQMQVLYDGVYNIQFSAQIVDTTSGGSDNIVNIFPRINGNIVPDSNTYVSMDNQNSYVVAAWNFVLKLNANDIIELIFYSTDTGIQLQNEPAVVGPPNKPAVPSLIVTVTQVAYSGPTGAQGPTGLSGNVQGITGATGINVNSSNPTNPIVSINNTYLSSNYLPLTGGTMSGSINMGNQTINTASLVSTTALTLNSRSLVYGATGASGVVSSNLYSNGVGIAPFLYSLPTGTVATPLLPIYNGENWIFSSNFVGVAGNTSFYANTSNTANTYSLPAGYYLNLNNRKATPIGINVYSVPDPITQIGPTGPTALSLPASSQRYLYWGGTGALNWTLL